MKHKRNINLFEKLLFIVGVLVIVVGYFLIYGLVASHGLSWDALKTIFLWILLIVVIIIAAVNENMKEELKVVILNQNEEIKLLREDINRKR